MSRPVRTADREAAQSYSPFPTAYGVSCRARTGRVARRPEWPVSPALLGSPAPLRPGVGGDSAIRPKCYQVAPRIDAPVARYTPVDSAQNFPELEERCSSAGASATSSTIDPPPRGLAAASSSTRDRRRPTAAPGSHHVLSRVFKDVFPRYKTMRGHLVAAQGRLGLPRPAGRAGGREGARLRDQGRHRALRRGRVQRQVPRVGAALHRRVERADRADRLLDRHRRRLLHAQQRLRRVGLVVAQAGLGEGPAGRGPQGRPVLHPRRHRAVLARGRARLPRRGRPERVRALPAARRARRLAARLDDDAVDARPARRHRRRPRRHLRARPPRRRDADPRRGAGRAGAGRGRRGRGAASPAPSCSACATSRPSRTSATTARRATPCWPATSSRSRTAPASCTPAPPSARTTSGSPPRTASRSTTRCGPTAPSTSAPGPFAGMYVRDADAADHRGAARVRPAVPRRRVRARLPALLALRHAAHLLRQDQLVRAHDGDEGRAARGQRDDRLVPGAHQARALRQVAREQRRLGAVARALLGHAAAGLALRRRGPRGLRRLAGRDRASAAAAAGGRAPALRRRGRAAPARTAAARCAACPT